MLRIISILMFFSFSSAKLMAHCQIPCGIYDDEGKMKELLLDVTTIEKSVASINEISAKDKPDYNQLVRWVTNKENHANNIINNMSNYYLAQRVKNPGKSDKKKYAIYQTHLESIHSVITLAMKAKQTSDAKVAGELRSALEAYGKFYEKNHH